MQIWVDEFSGDDSIYCSAGRTSFVWHRSLNPFNWPRGFVFCQPQLIQISGTKKISKTIIFEENKGACQGRAARRVSKVVVTKTVMTKNNNKDDDNNFNTDKVAHIGHSAGESNAAWKKTTKMPYLGLQQRRGRGQHTQRDSWHFQVDVFLAIGFGIQDQEVE